MESNQNTKQSTVSDAAHNGQLRSPFQFVVTPIDGKRYANTEKVGGVDLINHTGFESHHGTQRLAEVLSVPVNYAGEIEKGDILVVHHNVFRFYWDMRTKRKSGKSFFSDDIFLIDDDQYFMYLKNGEWRAKKGICFIKPVPVENNMFFMTGNQPLVGTIKYGSETTDQMGLKPGDKVSFLPETEYEFRINREVLYRMYTDHICMVL